jgi:hypothetical protein
MTPRRIALLCILTLLTAALPSYAFADSSHARIVRLSLVQGDVRFASSFHDDPLTDANAGWQVAPLNLPIRQGYVLATDNGRAEVEFENGAMAFLGANTVVEFYDLSLRDGDRITRLVLRQGTAIVYVNPDNGDYFSLTGGDFTVEAAGRTTFRLDNFDDGSSVNVEQGQVNVIRTDKPTPLEKGQSFSVRANDSGGTPIGRAPDSDDFDHWVSGRIESSVTATNYSTQYVNSADYTAGFGDLYTYGSWFPMGGYGYCWRPFGVGLGWSPFAFGFGSWYQDPFWGDTFIGSAPWGWLPYHYGGWVFSPVYGWVWNPAGFSHFGQPAPYRPATAVWVRSGTALGIVPLHPGDKFGKTAQNLSQGVYTVQGSQIAHSAIAAGAGNWAVLRENPRGVVASNTEPAAPPTRVARTIIAGPSSSGTRVVALSRDSSISYDPREHRFVNSNANPSATATKEAQSELGHINGSQTSTSSVAPVGSNSARNPNAPPAKDSATTSTTSTSARVGTPPRPPATPAPAHTSANNSRGSNPGSSIWDGSNNSVAASHPSSGTGSHPSGAGSHPH